MSTDALENFSGPETAVKKPEILVKNNRPDTLDNHTPPDKVVQVIMATHTRQDKDFVFNIIVPSRTFDEGLYILSEFSEQGERSLVRNSHYAINSLIWLLRERGNSKPLSAPELESVTRFFLNIANKFNESSGSETNSGAAETLIALDELIKNNKKNVPLLESTLPLVREAAQGLYSPTPLLKLIKAYPPEMSSKLKAEIIPAIITHLKEGANGGYDVGNLREWLELTGKLDLEDGLNCIRFFATKNHSPSAMSGGSSAIEALQSLLKDKIKEPALAQPEALGINEIFQLIAANYVAKDVGGDSSVRIYRSLESFIRSTRNNLSLLRATFPLATEFLKKKSIGPHVDSVAPTNLSKVYPQLLWQELIPTRS